MSDDSSLPTVACPTCLDVVTWGTGEFTQHDGKQIETYTCVNGHQFPVEVPYPVPDVAVPQSVIVEDVVEPDGPASELTLIKVALGQVAVYEDMIGLSPTVRLVEELVRDHEELEARIDAVLSYITGLQAVTYTVETRTVMDEVARLLKGGRRVPDDPSALEGLDG